MSLAVVRATDDPLTSELGRLPLPSRNSGVALWRPEIVKPGSVEAVGTRPIVVAEPALRPEALRAQVRASRAALARLAEAQATLDAQAAVLQQQMGAAGTERGQVAAVMETYRLKTALDEAVRAAARSLGALREERGRR
jgi:hypothetical protein